MEANVAEEIEYRHIKGEGRLHDCYLSDSGSPNGGLVEKDMCRNAWSKSRSVTGTDTRRSGSTANSGSRGWRIVAEVVFEERKQQASRNEQSFHNRASGELNVDSQ